MDNSLSIDVRAAIDLAVLECGGHLGPISCHVLGQQSSVDEFRRYAPIQEGDDLLVALRAEPEQIRAAVQGIRPRRVITVVDGSLARAFRRATARHDSPLRDLDRVTWQSLGYRQTGAVGVRGIGSLAWAVGEMLARRAGRPDLADRCKIGMLRTLVAGQGTRRFAIHAVYSYQQGR